MLKLFNITSRRYIQIILLLNLNSDKININNLCSKLSINLNTLSKDIKEINSNFSSILKLEIYNNLLINTYQNNCNIDRFFSQILKNCQTLNIVEAIFFNKFNRLEDIAKNQYTSSSTVFRRINEFNKVNLDKFNFIIDKNKFDFVGNENSIRIFFNHYFSEKYTVEEWPFKNIDKNKLKNTLSEILEHISIYNNSSLVEELCLSCSINSIRFNSGNSILSCLPMKTFDLDKIFNIEKKIYSLLYSLCSILGTNTSREAVINIFYNYLYKDFIFSIDEIVKNDNIFFEKCLKYGIKTTNYISKYYNLSLSNPYELITEVHNLNIIMKNNNIKDECIVFPRVSMHIYKLKKLFPEFIDDLRNQVENYLSTFPYPITDLHVTQFLKAVILSWKNLIPQLYKSHKKVKTLIVSRYSIESTLSMKEQMLLFFPNFLILDTYKSKSLDFEYIVKENYELLISDFSLPENFPINSVYINGAIEKEDIIKIMNIIVSKLY